ncbi:hypothetical protein D3C77_550500 [compost metagenome]
MPDFWQALLRRVEGTVDEYVEHGHGPDQARCALAALFWGRALSIVNPACQHRADSHYFTLSFGVRAKHQGVHLLRVAVALEQIGYFAPQNQACDWVGFVNAALRSFFDFK